MKKLLMILLAGVFIAGCSNDDSSNEPNKDNDQVAEDNGSEEENSDNNEGEEKKMSIKLERLRKQPVVLMDFLTR